MQTGSKVTVHYEGTDMPIHGWPFVPPGNQSHRDTQPLLGCPYQTLLLLHCAVPSQSKWDVQWWGKLSSCPCPVVACKVNVFYIDHVHTVTISEAVRNVLGLEASLEIGVPLVPFSGTSGDISAPSPPTDHEPWRRYNSAGSAWLPFCLQKPEQKNPFVTNSHHAPAEEKVVFLSFLNSIKVLCLVLASEDKSEKCYHHVPVATKIETPFLQGVTWKDDGFKLFLGTSN